MKVRDPNSTAWLWWVALLVLLAGGGITYMFSMGDLQFVARERMVVSISITGAIFGLCVICATAGWWLRR